MSRDEEDMLQVCIEFAIVLLLVLLVVFITMTSIGADDKLVQYKKLERCINVHKIPQEICEDMYK